MPPPPRGVFLALLLLPVCLQVTLSPTSPAGEASAHLCKKATEKMLQILQMSLKCGVSAGLRGSRQRKTLPRLSRGFGQERGEVRRCILRRQRAGGSIDARESLSPAGTSLWANDQVWEVKGSKTRPGAVSLPGPAALAGSEGPAVRAAGLQLVQESRVLGQSRCFSGISPGPTDRSWAGAV